MLNILLFSINANNLIYLFQNSNKHYALFIYVTFTFSHFPSSANNHGNDTADLDDIKLYDIVKVEHCLDQAYDSVPGHARKLEFKIEGDDPVYEFDIESTNDGFSYNVECNAEEGYIIEIEKEVDENDIVFKNAAKVSIDEARKKVLLIHPGRVVSEEREIGMDGTFTYEFDIQTKTGYEIKVDVDAVNGNIEEANFELYEIGLEKE